MDALQRFAQLAERLDLFRKLGPEDVAKIFAKGMTMRVQKGEMALSSEEPRSATAVAAEDTHLFVLSEDVFHKLMTKRASVQILLNIVSTLIKRLREANKKLKQLGESPPPS